MTVIVTSSFMASGSVTANTGNFRDFVSTWTTMFSQSGWVNTNASGSINPATVSASAAGGISGYQVWAFNDSLHNSGYPVYVKIEYGTPGATTQRTGFWISAGFTHDGSGSINPTRADGVGSTPRGSGIAIEVTTNTSYTHRLCCISSSDAVGMVASTLSNGAGVFTVERTKDAS